MKRSGNGTGRPGMSRRPEQGGDAPTGDDHSARINTARGMAQLKLNHIETPSMLTSQSERLMVCHACIPDELCLRCFGLHREQCLWQPEEVGTLGT